MAKANPFLERIWWRIWMVICSIDSITSVGDISSTDNIFVVAVGEDGAVVEDGSTMAQEDGTSSMSVSSFMPSVLGGLMSSCLLVLLFLAPLL